MKMTLNYKKYLFLIIALFAIKLVSMGAYTFHHPSEARYASIAMRMNLTGNYLMPYFTPEIPFFGKPPLSFWASAVAFKIFGVSEFVGRLPHFLALVTIALLLYRCIRRVYDEQTALTAVLLLLSCALFAALQSVMTEAFLLLGMTMITTSFWLQIESDQPKNIDGYLFFLGCIVAFLTKGPVGIAMPGIGIFVYLLISRRWQELFKKFPIILGAIIFLAVCLPWFVMAEAKYPGFLEYFLVGENFDRFAKPAWEGDRYGSAHYVPFATIWLFFALSTLPAFLIVFIKPKAIFTSSLKTLKSDKNFVFFMVSFLVPMLILTIMKNMIMTYSVYGLAAFAVILARVVVINNWQKLSLAIGYSAFALQCVVVLVLLVNPPILAEHLNYQTFLVKKIPVADLQNKNFQLYYLGTDRNIFELYLFTKDQVKTIKEPDLECLANKNLAAQYLIASESLYQNHQLQLKLVACTTKNQNCLYEFATK